MAVETTDVHAKIVQPNIHFTAVRALAAQFEALGRLDPTIVTPFTELVRAELLCIHEDQTLCGNIAAHGRRSTTLVEPTMELTGTIRFLNVLRRARVDGFAPSGKASMFDLSAAAPLRAAKSAHMWRDWFASSLR
jgi:hypothetical protein